MLRWRLLLLLLLRLQRNVHIRYLRTRLRALLLVGRLLRRLLLHLRLVRAVRKGAAPALRAAAGITNPPVV